MGIKQFILKDQIRFSHISGDYNPVHIDPVSARRTMFGSPIVHGVHGILWALDGWLKQLKKNVSIEEIKVNFWKPLKLNDKATVEIEAKERNLVRIKITSKEISITSLTIRWAEKTILEEKWYSNKSPPLSEPEITKPETLSSIADSIELFLPKKKILEDFPSISKYMDLNQLSVILGTTRIVGMKCPGKYSIFSELNLKKCDDTNEEKLKYNVSSYDDRFGMITLNLQSRNISGNITCFTRPSPKIQTSIDALISSVEKGEFKNQKALVIGGTRGLGEVIAKIITAGGGEVQISYFQGSEDAERVVAELNVFNKRAGFFRYNVLEENFSINDSIYQFQPTHLYYLATPHITQTNKGKFSDELYKTLRSYYVDGFISTILRFRDLNVKNFFYPSTAFIGEETNNFLEYVQAKEEAELVCDDVEVKDDFLIFKPSLPRMETDQTMSITLSDALDPVPVLLKELRNFNAVSL